MNKHIIVEGCDGSGKDTLIASLLGRIPGSRVHPRASTSLGGPIENLSDWVERTNLGLETLGNLPFPRWIFNRHPLISEYIYADKRFVNRGLTGPFRNRRWREFQSRWLSEYTILVVCQPSMDHVFENLRSTAGQHMPGVLENWGAIYSEYANLVWPGTVIRYNYAMDTVDDLVSTLNKMGV